MVGQSFCRSVRATAKVIALTAALVCSGVQASEPAAAGITEHDTPFSPENGGRDVRSLSVHPNGRDWLFVECARPDDGCQVMRYNLESGKLIRFALPGGYSYSYAHYSPRGTYIVLSRSPIYGTSEEEARRAIKASQILMMRSDGTGLQILPVAAGANLSPSVSQDDMRIAFWRSDRLAPPGKKLSLLDLNIWEYDLGSKSEKLFTGEKPNFLTGGDLLYLNQDELLVQSYGPVSRLRSPGYSNRYAGSEVFRLKRGQTGDPAPVMFPNTVNANMPSVDRQGSTFLWAGTEKDRSQGVMRITPDKSQTVWRMRAAFYPKYLMADPNGRYVGVIYWDLPMPRGGQLSGFAKLDLETNKWADVQIPAMEQAEVLPVSKL